MSSKTPTERQLDLRVRARHLTSGALDAPTLEAYLTKLPDLEGECEPSEFRQPALTRPTDDVTDES